MVYSTPTILFRWCGSKKVVQSSTILPFTSVTMLGSIFVNLPLKSPRQIMLMSGSTAINFSISFCNFLLLLKFVPDFNLVLSKYARIILIFVFLIVPSNASTSLFFILISSSFILWSFLNPMDRPPPLFLFSISMF